MADCTELTTCPFFKDKLDNAPATATLLKVKSCRGEFAKCARFLVSAKLGPVGE
jgi:hypothetical protein